MDGWDQGINLTNVDRIALGMGTRGNTTTAGGSGKMYFDDIRLIRPADAAEVRRVRSPARDSAAKPEFPGHFFLLHDEDMLQSFLSPPQYFRFIDMS